VKGEENGREGRGEGKGRKEKVGVGSGREEGIAPLLKS